MKNVSELKTDVVNENLLYAMALIKKARNIVCNEKSGSGYLSELDTVQEDLNITSEKLIEVISDMMFIKLDDAV